MIWKNRRLMRIFNNTGWMSKTIMFLITLSLTMNMNSGMSKVLLRDVKVNSSQLLIKSEFKEHYRPIWLKQDRMTEKKQSSVKKESTVKRWIIPAIITVGAGTSVFLIYNSRGK